MNNTIVYDLSAAQPMGTSPVSGGGAYAKRLFRRLVTQSQSVLIIAVAHKNKPLDQDLIDLARTHGIEVRYLTHLVAEILDVLRLEDAKVFFSALPLRFRKLQFPKDVTFMYTIHGLRPIELLGDRYEPLFFSSPRSIIKYVIVRLFPFWYRNHRRKDFRQLLDCATNRHIITVSIHSRYALLSEFPHLQSNEVSTYYSPADHKVLALDESILTELNLGSGDYFLLICGNRWAKNPYRALLALKNLSKKGLLNKQVLVTGRGVAPYLKKIEKLPGFMVCDYLPQAKLEALYKHAFAFIFPTLNEGFGYPPLECMQHGTPVITSPINSLPELLNNAVLWADPFSVMEMESRILRLQNDKEFYTWLSKEGIRRQSQVLTQQDLDLTSLVNTLLGTIDGNKGTIE